MYIMARNVHTDGTEKNNQTDRNKCSRVTVKGANYEILQLATYSENNTAHASEIKLNISGIYYMLNVIHIRWNLVIFLKTCLVYDSGQSNNPGFIHTS